MSEKPQSAEEFGDIIANQCLCRNYEDRRRLIGLIEKNHAAIRAAEHRRVLAKMTARFAIEIKNARADERAKVYERRFPIMGGPSIPWRMIEPHERQAQQNHDQSLERLAQRGGLGCGEAVAVLNDESYRTRREFSKEEDRSALIALLNADERAKVIEECAKVAAQCTGLGSEDAPTWFSACSRVARDIRALAQRGEG